MNYEIFKVLEKKNQPYNLVRYILGKNLEGSVFKTGRKWVQLPH